MSKQTFELVPTESLKPYDKNSNIHSEDQIKKLSASMKKLGFRAPILVWKDNQIMAGHARWEAAQQLGLKQVPIVRNEDMSETEMRAYVIADNKLREGSETDAEVMLSELTELAELDFDISLTGFDLNFLADEILENNLAPKDKAPNEYENEDREVIGDDDRKIHEPLLDDPIVAEVKSFCPECGHEIAEKNL